MVLPDRDASSPGLVSEHLIRRFLCGHPDPFRSVRDLGLAVAHCSHPSGELQGRSFVWLPAWLPSVGHHHALVLVTATGPFPGAVTAPGPVPGPSPGKSPGWNPKARASRSRPGRGEAHLVRGSVSSRQRRYSSYSSCAYVGSPSYPGAGSGLLIVSPLGLACSWLPVAPLEGTVKSDRREFPQEMRSTLDRLWKRGTLPQRAGQIPQPERVFRFQPVICSRSRSTTDPKETAVIRSFRRGAHPLAPGSKQPSAMISGDLTPHYDRLLRRTWATTLGPVRTQVSGHAEVSASDCQYPWLSASSGTQRARDLLIRSKISAIQISP